MSALQVAATPCTLHTLAHSAWPKLLNMGTNGWCTKCAELFLPHALTISKRNKKRKHLL
jgi:hypothetical protein